MASVSGAAETITFLQPWKQLKELIYCAVKPVMRQRNAFKE